MTFTSVLEAYEYPVAPRPPMKPARPPAHCDRREWRAYQLAEHSYRTAIAVLRASQCQ